MNFVEYIRMCIQNCALVALGLMLTATACIASWPILRAAWHDLKRGTFAALAALAAVCTICAQKTSGPMIQLDSLIRDAGCYATNNVFHAAATNAPAYAALDFSTSPVLVYARERGLTNATDWAELTPRRMFGDLPADYAIANATNYDYMVYLDYIPPSPAHTNGVFELRGFVIPGNGELETGNGERAAGFINSKPILKEDQ